MIYKFLLYFTLPFFGFFVTREIIAGKIIPSEYIPESSVGYCESMGPGQWESYVKKWRSLDDSNESQLGIKVVYI